MELERVLAERLKAHAGRAVICHPEPHGNRIALLQKPMHDLDVERSVPRPDIALGVIAVLQHRIVRCFDDRVVGTFRVFKLRPRLIGRKPEADAERARVVDAVFSRRVDQREALVGPGGKLARRRQGGGTQVLGIDGIADDRRRKSRRRRGRRIVRTAEGLFTHFCISQEAWASVPISWRRCADQFVGSLHSFRAGAFTIPEYPDQAAAQIRALGPVPPGRQFRA